MTLTEYLKRPGSLSRSQICEGLGISPSRLSHLRYSIAWPPALALAAEELTHGALSASDLSPIVRRARG